jgi:SAM-dependent methyltransferase
MSWNINCPVCFESEPIHCGELPPFGQHSFGGQPTQESLHPGSLYRCRRCFLYFRHPCPDENILKKMYAGLPSNVWLSEKKKEYWKDAEDICGKYFDRPRVLDVGCAGGDFLSGLPSEWIKFGIEPGSAAAASAEKKGIRILGSQLQDACEGSFDAITFFDVFEHIKNPLKELEHAAKLLSDKGLIFIFTGSTDAWTWRLFKPNYWYCSLPEHVSFFGQRWFRWAARKLNLEIVSKRAYSPEKLPWRKSVADALKVAVYALSRSVAARGIRLGRVSRWKTAPWWLGANDHVMVVLSKKALA